MRKKNGLVDSNFYTSLVSWEMSGDWQKSEHNSLMSLVGVILVIIAVATIAGVYIASDSRVRAENSKTGEYWISSVKVYRVKAYCPCEKCCGEYADGRTASGYVIEPGACFVAADKIYPFNSFFVIPGYNDGMPVPCLDRGGNVKGYYQLEVFFHTHQEAIDWGVKWLKVKTFHHPPPKPESAV